MRAAVTSRMSVARYDLYLAGIPRMNLELEADGSEFRGNPEAPVSCWRGRRLRPQLYNQRQNLLVPSSGNGDLGHLEGDAAAMADDLGADLGQLLFQARQRPVLDRFRRRRTQEIAEIISERKKLDTHRGLALSRGCDAV